MEEGVLLRTLCSSAIALPFGGGIRRPSQLRICDRPALWGRDEHRDSASQNHCVEVLEHVPVRCINASSKSTALSLWTASVPQAPPLPACGERSRAKQAGEGDSPRPERLVSPPHSDPL